MRQVNVVLFSGGRGSQVLSEQLLRNDNVRLTLAVNGYDDGLSTGEVRRFLPDSLGPSDYRKNASTVARALGSCDRELIELLDLRFPIGYLPEQAIASMRCLRLERFDPESEFDKKLHHLAASLDSSTRASLGKRLDAFVAELGKTGFGFHFSDCSLGNVLFAGSFLEMERDFNRAIDDYCRLLNVPDGYIQNVTDGTNAFLVALDREQQILASEADIVDANRRNYIAEIFLIDKPPSHWIADLDQGDLGRGLRPLLEAHSLEVKPNPALLDRIAEAHVIVFAPGTQHSSLLPSYITCGLGIQIARNLSAVKILVTNLQEDAEIPDTSAVEIIEKALFYLREKNKLRLPAPFLITHYLLNDPTHSEPGVPYVPLGRLQNLDDPRLVRIGNYEDGLSGRHNARKVLTPFIEAFLKKDERLKIAVLLLDTQSVDKISQSILEANRAGLGQLSVVTTFFYHSPDSLDTELLGTLPFQLRNTWRGEAAPTIALADVMDRDQFDFVVLFESSGMYRGDDIVNLVALLPEGRFDAVWGSRRLSVRDIRESYHLRYRRHPVLGAISYLGSHLLSLAYLFLYGRHISDVLSGARAIRTTYLRRSATQLDDKRLNQNLLSPLLLDGGEVFETPVQFLSLSPKMANRTTAMDGLRGLATIIRWRFRQA